MSLQRRNIAGLLIILGFIFTIDWISQTAWIFWVTHKSEKNIERCLKIDDKNERTQCFVTSIRERNQNAFFGVNGYLITIVGSFAVSGILLLRAKREQKRAKENDHTQS